MDEMTRRIVMDRRGSRGGRKDYGYDMRGRRDGRGEWEAEIRGEYERDGRRGVKGTGRYGIGGRDYYPRRDRAMNEYDYDERYDDYGMRGYDEDDYGYGYGMRDYRDYGEGEMKLTKRELKRAERKLMNADGTEGAHFKDMQQILNAAQQVGVKYDGYDEAEFCFTMNMIYSDECLVNRKYIPQERDLIYYADRAKTWLVDEDAPIGSVKLYLYVKDILDEAE